MNEEKKNPPLGPTGRAYEDRETVGKIATDLASKEGSTENVIDLQRSMQESYPERLLKEVKYGRTIFPNDFFIVVVTKKERLFNNVLRNYFLSRATCPTPEYDQAVYHFHQKDEKLVFLWQIPDKETCYHLQEHAHEVVKEEQQLLQYALGFFDGSLLTWAKQLNGEEPDTPFIA